MLSRVGLLSTIGSSHRYRTKHVAGVGAASFAGLWAINSNNNAKKTNLESSCKLETDLPSYTNLMIPTVEATVRAARLLSTVILIIGDYEYGKFYAKFVPESNPRRLYWEKEKERRKMELERSQVAYTNYTPQEELQKTGKSRKELIREQKDAVLMAAESLAEAEEELYRLGSRKRDAHLRAAHRLLELCHKNGGCYIKIGQHLANLDYLIPNEYIETLSSLFNEAPQSTYSSVCKVIEEDLGKSPEQLFCSFQEKPIASASLAQVHVAYDKKTGKKLAIKVQHRGLRETSSGDLFALTSVIGAVEYFFQDFTWGWIADEIAPQLPKELDFSNEGRNAEMAAQYIDDAGMSSSVVVPRIHWEKSSSRVLCMDFEEGFKATDQEAIEKTGLKKQDIAKLVSSVFQAQMFGSGFVHCDPHPANVLIRPNPKNGIKPQMVLVDHGLYKQIDDDFRIKYANLWQALMLADLDGIKKYCSSLGVDKMYSLLASILTARPYDEIMERAKTGSLSSKVKDSKSDKAMMKGYAQYFLKDIIDMLGTLPRQMLLLLKMNDCLRHIDTALGSPTNTLVTAGRHAARAVYDYQITHNRSWTGQFYTWLNYMKVIFRIQIHDIGVWWLDKFRFKNQY